MDHSPCCKDHTSSQMSGRNKSTLDLLASHRPRRLRGARKTSSPSATTMVLCGGGPVNGVPKVILGQKAAVQEH